MTDEPTQTDPEAAARRHLDALAKPPGSLGRLEDLAARLCATQRTLRPRTRPRRLVVFAADHGVAAEGVTEWPPSVTGLMVRAILDRGAACSVLAEGAGADLRLVDVGTLNPPGLDRPGYRVCKVAEGTANLLEGPAMTVEQFGRAVDVGRGEAAGAADDGMRVVVGGELGIGNTTSASCLAVLLASLTVEAAVGRGAGASDATLARKREVVRQASARAIERFEADPVGAIASVAGFEIAALAGFFAEGHRRGLTVVLDGMIATSAALVAEAIAPGSSGSMVAAHRSAEPAHGAMLGRLGLAPLLGDWGLRLGEGTGGLLALPLLDAAAALMAGMSTLQDLGIAPTRGLDDVLA